MARIEDRWVRKDKTRTERYGQGLRYRVELTPPGETKKRKSFATKTAAEQHLVRMQADIYKGVYIAPKERILLRDYAQTWVAHQLHQRTSSKQTISRRMPGILKTLGDKALDDIRRQDVQLAVIEWSEGQGLAPATVKLAYTYLSGMMKSAVLDELIPASPCIKIRMPKVETEPVRPLRKETVQQIVETLSPEYRPMAVFCAATGLRSGEMRGLTWDRLDLAAGMVTVDRQLTTVNSRRPAWGPPKTAASRRTIHIGKATVAMLQTLKAGPVAVGGLVFAPNGRAMVRVAASQNWRTMREKIPEAGDGWHQLRHYHASELIAGGMSPVAVAHRLGHKDATETLKTYAHLWPDDDTRAAALTDGLISLNTPEMPPA